MASTTGTSPGEPAPVGQPERVIESIGGRGGAGAERLSNSTIMAFAMPRIAFSIMGTLMLVYFMKFSTDVLLIAPAAIGVVMAGARIWDAISDPVAGYLSDRTNSRFGRRRVWMYAAAIPLGFATYMLWSPPSGIGAVAIIAWMGAAVLLYETATTAYYVPHSAIGVELTPNYHERTRLFGYTHMITAVGALVGLGALYLMDVADDKRGFAQDISLVAGIIVAVVILWSTSLLPERADYQGRGGDKVFQSFWDVARNPHARLLLVIYGIESLGIASVAIIAPYMMDYIWDDMKGKLVFLVGTWSVSLYASTPLWMWLARRFSKKQLWMTALWMNAVGFLAFFLVQDDGPLVWMIVFVIGLSGACGAVIEPSIRADVIDYDEFLTGERKEGTYNAVWNFVRKAASSITALATGLALQFSGFEPNVEQTQATEYALRGLNSVLPGVCYVIGALLFIRFAFNEQEHTEVRQELDARRQAASR